MQYQEKKAINGNFPKQIGLTFDLSAVRNALLIFA
jgi:hypothetical protein